MRKIEDFGKKIGGARKDNWSICGICPEDLYEMTAEEKRRYVTRDYVWPLPNAKKLVEEEGVLPFVAYWQRKVRLCVQKGPVITTKNDFDQAILEYVQQVRVIYDLTMKCKTYQDVETAERTFRSWKKPGYASFHINAPVSIKNISYKILHLQYRKNEYMNYVKNTNFPYQTKATAQKSKRKKMFIPPQLFEIRREGIDYRHHLHVYPEKWQEEFYFYGVEFGNWLSQKDRQISMDYCYDALKDLSYVLDVEDKDIAFEGKLSLAFGARGCSHASAHYERDRRVINLTKMHGAGCTAHEWFHALDHYIAQVCNVPDGKLATETAHTELLPKSLSSLCSCLKYDCMGEKTDYLRGSQQFHSHFAKDSFGSWASTTEMAARAFACYVKDCLGVHSDYLIAHADVYEFEYENMHLCAIPQGEERELFNELFDQLFFELKEMGILHQKKEKVTPAPCIAETIDYHCDYEQVTAMDYSGQYTFQF